MKKITIVVVVMGVLAVSAYLFARFSLKTNGYAQPKAADSSLQTKPKESVLDLRPKLINRLQELVSKGSNGLFTLNIAEADPDILASTITLKNVSVQPDTAVMNHMTSTERVKCDIFKFKSDSIHITGIGVKDIFSKEGIDLKKVFINAPVIDIIQKSGKKRADSLSLYECLFGHMNRISANEIVVRNGTVINHATAASKPVSFQNLEVRLSDLLIDSSTENDRSRFLYSKNATISLRNYFAQSKDGFYNYTVDKMQITTSDNSLKATNVKLHPLYDKQSFAKKAGSARERYELTLPSVHLKNVDWWSLASNESFVADEAILDGGHLDIYLNRSLPQKISRMGNYPHQLLMKLPLKINIGKLKAKNVRFDYAEFNPHSGRQGQFSVKKMNGLITNLTNMSSAIAKNSFTTVHATGGFMGLSKAELSLQLNLKDYKNGSFTASLDVNGFDGKLINPLAEPIGMFSIKKGKLKELKSTVSGNNKSASGKVVFLYDDLHIAALENDPDKEHLDKKDVTSFLANAFLVKKENPAGSKDPRKPDCSFNRDPYASFFNLIWKTTFVGILKTTGLPEKMAYKK